eukprot:CAMPEP_0179472914 /NCGR_PEP_ID=MMETSP0799-20121207/52800_1 /TAXON_ID=46947 /ORGANISM="Geminigera cryophila, Strain CCMP2564" /LENGTH=80 /DNA_ID=CAMNT_0021281313 /DNA_START=422 /DNA_END=664 /DNA_ORIENTATION=-
MAVFGSDGEAGSALAVGHVDARPRLLQDRIHLYRLALAARRVQRCVLRHHCLLQPFNLKMHFLHSLQRVTENRVLRIIKP